MKAIQTKIIPATDHRPTRIKAMAEGVPSITFSRCELENAGAANLEQEHALAAHTFARKYDWHNELVSGVLPNGDWCHALVPERREPVDTGKAAFIGFLKGTLIPDLRESGSDATADDFETCIHYMRDGSSCNGLRRAARNVVRCWESGDLASAVRELNAHI